MLRAVMTLIMTIYKLLFRCLIGESHFGLDMEKVARLFVKAEAA